jgi:hypothetical protein
MIKYVPDAVSNFCSSRRKIEGGGKLNFNDFGGPSI